MKKTRDKNWCFSGILGVNNLPAMQETQETYVPSLGLEDSLEKEMATHSSTFAWEILWIEALGGLQPMRLQRVRHDLETKPQQELVRVWKKESYCALLVVIEIHTAVMESNMKVPHKIENRTTIWFSNSTSGFISQGNKIRILKRYLHTHKRYLLHWSTIHNSQDMEATKLSISEWMNQEENCSLLFSLVRIHKIELDDMYVFKNPPLLNMFNILKTIICYWLLRFGISTWISKQWHVFWT